MSNLFGAMIGAAIDRRDGDSGIKGAVVGALTQSAVRVAVPIIATFALGWAVQYAIQKGYRALVGEDVGPDEAHG